MNNVVNIPESADEAAEMMRVSAEWLSQNAPETLRAVMRGTSYAADAERWKTLRDVCATLVPSAPMREWLWSRPGGAASMDSMVDELMMFNLPAA